MNAKCQYRFVLLDFGHPMSTNTIKNIINSLENILLLSLAFSQKARESTFGISVLNSNFAVFNCFLESSLRKNYDLVVKNLQSFLKKSCKKVTVQEFKNLLRSSIEKILCELQRKFKMEEIVNRELIQIAVVTKKNAWVLSDILKSVTGKLNKINFSVKNFKVVQISNEIQRGAEERDNSFIASCIFCSDDPRDINQFFKDWLLNPQRHLRILVSRDANLEIECEVEDCVVNPFSFPSKFGDVWPGDESGTSTQVCNLEIINRLPVSGLCPTLLFGTPRRIRATESKLSSRMFKELCKELNRTGQGLLAKSSLPTEQTNLITFHFLTSDGHMILLNDVAPDELQLPKREDFSNSVNFCQDDASFIKNCLEKVKFLDAFKAENFSSGIYEFLKEYFDRLEHNKSSFAFFGETPPNDDKERRKRQKLCSGKEVENVHPALLSSKVVEKYRKVDKHAFNLPELGKEFSL